MKNIYTWILAVFGFFIMEKSLGQDLDPRAYARVPIKVTVLVAGISYSDGGIVTDATLPLKDLNAQIGAPSLAVVRTFGLLGRTAQVSAALPYAWGKASATISGEQQSTTRSGIGDMRFRFSWLLLGAPAATLPEFAKIPRKTILGISIGLLAPTGQYFPEKLINIGTSRWTFKTELALSQPVGKRWLVDFYSGLVLFTKNDSYYPGNSVRSQKPLGAFQGHVSYNIQPLMWVAFDCTFYTGGNSSINGVEMDDRQSNSRVGATFVLPVGKRNSIKFAYSRGAIIRSGANFTTVSVGWQTSFLGKQGKKDPQSN